MSGGRPVPSPVESSVDATNTHENDDVLAVAPRPALDGAAATTPPAKKRKEMEPGGGASSQRPRLPTEIGADFAKDDGAETEADADARAAVAGAAADEGYERGSGSDDDDPEELDEGAMEIPTLDSYVPRAPSYAKANDLPFVEICRRLEGLWNIRYHPTRKRPTMQKRQAYLLTPKLKAYLEGGSPFPLLRLLLPQHDNSRAHTGLKEARIAVTWARALALPKGGRHHGELEGYKNPTLVRNQNSVGDLSCVVMDVVRERDPRRGSTLTVGEVNDWLDVLVGVVKDRLGMPVEEPAVRSDWRRSLERAVAAQGDAKKQDKYVTLVEKLTQKDISPEEHKFIIRILLQNIHVGLNLKEILGYMSPYAIEIYNSFNDLKETCTRLSDPDYVRLHKATVEKNAREIMENHRNIWMTPSTLPAALQKTISPMLSCRTGFDRFLKDLAHRHNQLDKALPKESFTKSCLAIKHPAFLCEIKMDGERDLIHVKGGIVTVQTRNGNWYSHLYSPAIGPAIRAALAGYDVDVILDGEMIAWDAVENKPVPFGSNRAVAEMHRNRRVRDRTLDQRDVDLHKNETDINIMTLAKDKQLNGSFGTSKALEGVSSDNYWLQYVVFDILYLGGPDAQEVLEKSRHLFSPDAPPSSGSLINMDCMQRKSILYHLIRPQKKVVEHVRSVVVRSDGSSLDAADYFLGNCLLEYGKTPCELDSIYLALCEESNTTKFDIQRMCGRTHEDIEIERSKTLELVYKQIVDLGGQEGLIFKDLASPYYLGAKSRLMRYWWKLKPDYDESGRASDIDLLVLGGRYAAGFDKRGMISSVIVGCLEHDYYGCDGAKYMAVTKLKLNKHTEQVLFRNTGYQTADENGHMQMGSWFESECVPDFLSLKSYQRDAAGDNDGWKPEKKDLPDVWIKPEDSFVITINAGEFQTSKAMQAGFSLRFPRVSKYRGKGDEDPKSPDEVCSWDQLKVLFEEQEENRQHEVSFGSQVEQVTSRFLTAKQLQMSGKQKAAKRSRRQINEVKQFHIPVAGATLSSALKGFIFSVQPGNYCLLNDSFTAAKVKENEWATAAEANSVRDRLHVVQFIQSHGGICELAVHKGTDFLLGGTATDAKVTNLRTLMANTDMCGTAKKYAEARRLVEMGILKWTFVYSIVSTFLKRIDDDALCYEKSIKKDWPSLAHPRLSDYLCVSDSCKTTLAPEEDQFGLHINKIASPLDFRRALEEVGRQQSMKKGGAVSLWQNQAMQKCLPLERWIFGGKAQKLWPYRKHADMKSSLCILYPDLFADLGLEAEDETHIGAMSDSGSRRWEEIIERNNLGKVAAVLPLAKALGAIVTPHLHSGVTHVLCDLKRHTKLKWTPRVSRDIFTDTKSGSRLHERLVSLDESAALEGDYDKSVLLVSPDWLEEKWNDV